MFNFTQPIPLSLYIHIPWCIRKCWYCDFNSHALREEIPEDKYVAQLISDLEEHLPDIAGRRLTSIFLGGGTPSLLSPDAIQTLLSEIHRRLPYSPWLEITLEANPSTVELTRFKAFREAGINRLSMGIQSFQDDKLKALGRVHDSQTAYQAVETAHKAGFQTFNMDLMYGLPSQTLEDSLYDLQTALSLSPPHLSWYHLTIEPNTLFYQQPPKLPTDEQAWDIQEKGLQLIQQAGFEQYEISAYSKPEHQCRHNINYWEFGDYLGIGAGAHSKITNFKDQTVRRIWKVKHPKDYLDSTKNKTGGEKIITKKEMPFEFMLNALRLMKPIPYTLFEERTGLPISTIEKPLVIAQNKGLIQHDHTQVLLTALGKSFVNDLITIFLDHE